MKIVILDAYTTNPGDLSWAEFEKLGDFTAYDYTPSHLTVERAKDAEIVITNKTVLPREVLEQLPKLKNTEAHASVIVSTVDSALYRKLGIRLTTEPKYQTKKLYHA